jgi:hypothetical protein
LIPAKDLAEQPHQLGEILYFQDLRGLSIAGNLAGETAFMGDKRVSRDVSALQLLK